MRGRKIVGGLLLFSVAASWGGTYVATKFIMSSIPVFSLMLGRYAIAFAILLGICMIRRERLPGRKDLAAIAAPALLGYFVSIALQFWGTDLCGASVASLINVSSTLFAAVLAVPVLGESLTARKLTACAVGFVGVALVIGFASGPSSSLLGGIVMLACAATWALMTIMFKRIANTCSSLTATTCAIGFAFAVCVPFSAFEMIRDSSFYFADTNVILSILYIGIIATAYAFFAWNKGMTMMDVGTGSLFIYFQPMAAAALGWLLMGEKLNWSFFAGGALLVLAMLIAFGKSTAPAHEIDRVPHPDAKGNPSK